MYHRFSVEAYERMVTVGILTKEDRVELIRGWIIEKMPTTDRHSGSVRRLNRLFSRIAESVLVSVKHPIRLPDSVPEPVIALVKLRADFYASGKPRPADVLLLIEVADTSLDNDREVKRPLYAEAGILEYWIVNLTDDSLEVHRSPTPDGTYADVRTLRRGQQVDIVALAGLAVAVDELL
jgi:Uma2 family endonuclease